AHPELGREAGQRRWYYCLSSGRVGRRQALKPASRRTHSQCFQKPLPGDRAAAFLFGAGWSSPVARQAHNLKVAGSNPAPATNTKAAFGRLFSCPIDTAVRLDFNNLERLQATDDCLRMAKAASVPAPMEARLAAELP